MTGVVVFVATLVFLDGGRIAEWIGGTFHLGASGTTAWLVMQTLMAVLLSIALCIALFKLLPNVQQRWTGAIDPLKGAIYLGRIVSDEGPGTPSMSKYKQAQ